MKQLVCLKFFQVLVVSTAVFIRQEDYYSEANSNFK